MPVAKIREASTTISVIEDPEQVKNVDNLTTEDRRKILIVKSGNTALMVARVLTEFSQRLDRAGNKFKMHRGWRSLSQTSPYGEPVRISAAQMEEFLTEWFLLVEHVHSAPPQTVFNVPLKNAGPQSYFKILDRLPPFVPALIGQQRFVTQSLVSMFEVIG
jgi:hypothetical protein